MVAPEHDVYLTARQVRERYGNASDSWITRKQREAGFPPHTTRFGGRRRYWRLGELLAWEAAEGAARGITGGEARTGSDSAPYPGRTF